MFRAAYVLLTIAGILACPFSCMAKVGDHRASVEQQAGCSCCQDRQAPDGERRGPANPEGCDCTCLCKGAVETKAVPMADLDVQLAFAVCLDACLLRHPNVESPSLFHFGESPPPPQLGSGRMIRLALASLLL